MTSTNHKWTGVSWEVRLDDWRQRKKVTIDLGRVGMRSSDFEWRNNIYDIRSKTTRMFSIVKNGLLIQLKIVFTYKIENRGFLKRIHASWLLVHKLLSQNQQTFLEIQTRFIWNICVNCDERIKNFPGM